MKVNIIVTEFLFAVLLVTLLVPSLLEYAPYVIILTISSVLYDVYLKYRIKLFKYISFLSTILIMIIIIMNKIAPAYILSRNQSQVVYSSSPILWYLKLSGISDKYIYYDGKQISSLTVIVGKKYDVVPVVAYKLINIHNEENASWIGQLLCSATSLVIKGYNWSINIPSLYEESYGIVDGVGVVICSTNINNYVSMIFSPIDKYLETDIYINYFNYRLLVKNITVPLNKQYNIVVPQRVYYYIKKIENDPTLLKENINNTYFQEAKKIVTDINKESIETANNTNKMLLVKFYFPVFLLVLSALLFTYFVVASKK